MIGEQTAPLTHRSGLRSLISHVFFFLVGNFAQRVRVCCDGSRTCRHSLGGIFFKNIYFVRTVDEGRALCVRAPRAELFTSAAVLVRLL